MKILISNTIIAVLVRPHIITLNIDTVIHTLSKIDHFDSPYFIDNKKAIAVPITLLIGTHMVSLAPTE